MMISIKKKINFFFLLVCIFQLASCDTIKNISGFNKQKFDDSMVVDTPDIILPPDFNTVPTDEPSNTYTNSYSMPKGEILDNNSQFTQPKVQNLIRPNMETNNSKSPSDSLEKFRNVKKFTVGEWVYDQSVRDFKGNNLFYRQPKNKGYNFSRRYLPKTYQQQNFVMPRNFPKQNIDNNYSDLSKGSDSNLIEIDQVPVLD